MVFRLGLWFWGEERDGNCEVGIGIGIRSQNLNLCRCILGTAVCVRMTCWAFVILFYRSFLLGKIIEI